MNYDLNYHDGHDGDDLQTLELRDTLSYEDAEYQRLLRQLGRAKRHRHSSSKVGRGQSEAVPSQ